MINKRILNTEVDITSECLSESLNVLGTNEAHSSNVATYKLNGDATDVSGNYSGSGNGITYSTGKFGQAALFNTNSSVDVSGDIITRSSDSSMTWSSWINFTNVHSSSFRCLVGSNSGGGFAPGAFAINLYGSSSGISCSLERYYNNTQRYSNSYATAGLFNYSANTWYHLVLSYDSSTNDATVYIDGSKVGSSYNLDYTNSGYSSYANLAIGNYATSNAGYGFDGMIDQVRIFNSALNANQAAALYNETASDNDNMNLLNETLPSSNVATYRLDGNSNDETGDHNGSDTNVTYSTGEFGQAATFNGSTSRIDLGNKTFFNSGDFSVSFWFRREGNETAYQYIMSQKVDGQYESTSPISISCYGNNYAYQPPVLYFAVGASYIRSNTNLSSNVWYHVTCTIVAGGDMKIYVDGVLDSNAYTETTTRPTPIQNLAIGANGSNNTYNFNGSLDQVRIFDKAISQDEVNILYNETVASTTDTNILGESSAVALYPLTYDASEVGGLDGTPTNVDFGVGGAIGGYGARFNGSSSRINLPSNPINGLTSVSFSFWLKPSDIARKQYVLSFINGVGGWNGLGARISESGKIQLVRANNGAVTSTENSTTSLSLNVWQHIAFTVQQSGTVIYINGSEDGTFSNTPFTTNSTGSFDIGMNEYSPGITQAYTDGSIDQVRIFSKVLNSDEITQLYEEQACEHTATAGDINYPDGETAVALYKLDNSAYDEVTGNTATESNVEYRFGRFGQAAVFNGSSSKIEVSDPVIPVGAASISFWFNNDNTSGSLSGGETHYILGSGVSSSSRGLTAGFFQQKFFAVVNNGASSSSLTGTTLFSKTNWNHCAITWDGTTGTNKLKIYVNGGLEIKGTSSIAASTIASYTNFAIGGTLSSGFIGGRVDGVRIYDTALDASQVQELYNEKPEVDNSNFKAVTYTGTGATQYISNVGMDLETNGGMVWVKNRSATGNHSLIDSVRGVSKPINSNATNAEQNYTNFTLTSFEKNGFSITDDSNGLYGWNGAAGGTYGGTTGGYVGWVFKGGGDAVLNQNGTLNSQVSANVESGFSIVSYTGTSTIGDTIGHGLDTPDLIIVKNLDNSSASWAVWSSAFSAASETLFLDLTSPSNQYTNRFGTVNSTTFQAGSSGGTEVNASGNNFIAYIFKSVAGYSSIGSYTGTGSAGKSVTTGFQPSWIIVKRTNGSGDWNIWDAKRGNQSIVWANGSNAEATNSAYEILFNSTGFVVNATGSFVNGNNDSYVYMAIK